MTKLRTCCDCPADISHRHQATQRCNGCAEARDKLSKKGDRPKPVQLRCGKHCTECMGLPWRRPLCGCSTCGRAFQLEPVLKR